MFTNKPIVTPVRGAGRQHGVFVSERLLDIAAKELGIDRVEIRKRNLLGPGSVSAQPRDHVSGLGAARVRQRQLPADARAGRGADRLRTSSCARNSRGCAPRAGKVGIGIACYVEGTGIGPYEGARVTVEPSGKVRVATGVGTQGQGHFTVLAQIVADVLGVDVEDVRVVTGDTREFHWGTGHVRQPRRGRGRQRVSCGGDVGAREDSRPRERGARRRRRTGSSSAAAA